MSHNCRLCLTEDSEAYSKIETEDCLKQLESIIPEIDLTLTEGPVICTKCSNSLFSAYTFKLNCLMIEKKLQLSLNEPQKIEYQIEYKSEHKSEDKNGIENDTSFNEVTNNSSEIEFTKEEPTVVCEKLQVITNSSMPKDGTIQESLKAKFMCKFCGSVLANYKEWIEHIEIHTINKNSCGVCDKSFGTRDQFLKHRDTHLVNKCLLCGQEFLYKSTLSKHTKERHIGEELPDYPFGSAAAGNYECDVCGLKSKTKLLLVQHIRIHTGERPYKCTICNKTFTQSSALSTHIKSVHFAERPHKCEICGKGFPVRGAYTAHMKIHEKLPNNFVCHHCGKSFALPRGLKDHIRRHNCQKRIVCHVCNKSFININSLKAHLRSQCTKT